MLTRHLSAASRISAACAGPTAPPRLSWRARSRSNYSVSPQPGAVSKRSPDLSFAEVLFLMPPVILIATVRVSIAGWGVRERSMVVAFGYAGLAQSDGLTLSIILARRVSLSVWSAGSYGSRAAYGCGPSMKRVALKPVPTVRDALSNFNELRDILHRRAWIAGARCVGTLMTPRSGLISLN